MLACLSLIDMTHQLADDLAPNNLTLWSVVSVCSRIEHAMTGFWLHALSGETKRSDDEKNSKDGVALAWTTAVMKGVRRHLRRSS